MIGRTYHERGRPVVVLIRWGALAYREPAAPIIRLANPDKPRGAPRNVLIRRGDGSTVVRPFRGLRKPVAAAPPTGPDAGGGHPERESGL